MKVRRLGYALGAEITGVALSRRLEAGEVAEIRAAWLEHIVLCIPGQDLSVAEMGAFCAQFGELDDNRASINRNPAHPEVMSMTNRPVVIGEKRAAAYTSNHWHSDNSHTVRPTTITFLLAKQLPDIGGDTMFANTHMAYESLSPAYKATIDPLLAIDDYKLGRAYGASTPEAQAKSRAAWPPVVQPLVRVHPENGRKAIFVGNRVRRLVGMSDEESGAILDYLKEHVTRYEFVYRHRWKPNDLILWDNRSTLHYAVPDYDQSQERRMLRATLVGPQTGRVFAPESEAERAAVTA